MLETANVLVALAGDIGNTVPKYGATAAEVAVLRAIHGEGAVTDITVLSEGAKEGTRDRTNAQELARLRYVYGAAKDGDDQSIVGLLFPGAAARVFETFEELALPDGCYAVLARATTVKTETAATEQKADATTEASAPDTGLFE